MQLDLNCTKNHLSTLFLLISISLDIILYINVYLNKYLSVPPEPKPNMKICVRQGVVFIFLYG